MAGVILITWITVSNDPHIGGPYHARVEQLSSMEVCEQRLAEWRSNTSRNFPTTVHHGLCTEY